MEEPMLTPVTVSGSLTFRIQYRATRAVVKRLRATLFGYGLFVLVPMVTLILMLSTGYDTTSPGILGLPAWVALSGGPYFMFVLMPLIQAVNVWQIRRRNASIGGVLTFILSPDGFESRGQTFETKLRWDAFHRIIEAKEFFLFYVSSSSALFIPKSFASPTEIESIRAIVRQFAGAKAKLMLKRGGRKPN
jgi:hypothetical protein